MSRISVITEESVAASTVVSESHLDEDEEEEDKFSFDLNGSNNENDDWVPGTAATAQATIEISISCRNLPDRDLLSKSDPMCVVFHRPPNSRKWVQLTRTEVIWDDLNPDFAAKAQMEYKLDHVQPLRFEVYDVDSESDKLGSQDILGFLDTSLSQIISGGPEGSTMELTTYKSIDGEKEKATITLTAEELTSEKEEVFLKLGGSSIGSMDFGCWLPKSFYCVSKLNEASRYLVVHRSPTSRGLLKNGFGILNKFSVVLFKRNPIWTPLRLSTRSLCNGDEDRELKIEVFQRKFSGALIEIGSVLMTLNKLIQHAQKSTPEKIQLMSSKGQPSTSYIRILACTLTPLISYIDYIRKGTQLYCCFAIDFTCSNGDPSDSVCLHYLSTAGHPNVYEQAITAIGSVLQDYCTEEYYVYGFGARIPPNGDISHNFNITLSKSALCYGIPGVIEAYKNVVPRIQFYGPTNFSPMIKTVADMASKSKNGSSYYILVILTDGVITDTPQAKKAIVLASILPISIIIVGIGDAEMDHMEELDGDAFRVSHKRKIAERDIVQFIAYRSASSWKNATGEATIAEHQPKDETKTDQQQQQGSAPQRVVSPLTPLSGETTPNFNHSRLNSANKKQEENDKKKLEKEKEKDKENEDDEKADIDKNVEERTRRLENSALAQEIMAELPKQITSYMKNKGIALDMIPKPVKKPRPEEEDKEKMKAEGMENGT